MARTSLGPGFRFHPTDIELVCYYLKRKILRKPLIEAIAELELYKFSPWDLPDKSCLRSKDREWYFFCPKDRKYSNGPRTNRATETGFWKTTGKDRAISYESKTVGMKKTLIFHLGRAPRGDRTNWVMHEYRLEIKDLADAGISQDSYVLCKIFQKSGAGPRNGEDHGAPFKEEEWEDDLLDNSLVPLPLVDSGSPSVVLDDNNIVTEDTCLVLEKKHESSLQPPCHSTSIDAKCNNFSLFEQFDLDSILALLGKDNDPSQTGNDKMPELNDKGKAPILCDGTDVFEGLEDLASTENLNGIETSTYLFDDGYMELDDLDATEKYPVEGGDPEHILHPNLGNRLERERGGTSGLPNSPLSLENVPSMWLEDLDFHAKYPLGMTFESVTSGNQFGCSNFNGLEGASVPFVSLKAALHASEFGSSGSMLPKNSGAFADKLDMPATVNLSSLLQNSSVPRETLSSMGLTGVDFPIKYPFGNYDSVSYGERVGNSNCNSLDVFPVPHISFEAVPASGVGLGSSSMCSGSSHTAGSNINGTSVLYQDHIGSGGSSVGGYEEANQSLDIVEGRKRDISYTSGKR